jgi:hypothetical protein
VDIDGRRPKVDANGLRRRKGLTPEMITAALVMLKAGLARGISKQL